MDRYDEGQVADRPPLPAGERPVGAEAGPPRVEKKRRKVSLIAAIVVNVVTLVALAIVLLVVLLPGYRRSFTMARAVKGADEVWVIVRTSEDQMRANKTDFLSAQDGLKNALQELVKSGGDNTFGFVRDSLPDQAWVSQNLPQDMQQWLQQLYPAAPPTAQTTELNNGGAQAAP
jgi:hypothetical protein